MIVNLSEIMLFLFVCVCLLLMWVGLDLCSYLRSMLRFIAVHIIFTQVQYDYYRRFVFVCCCFVYCFILFCSSQGIAWMQKVMVPRSNSLFFFHSHAWTSVKSAYFSFIEIFQPSQNNFTHDIDGALHWFVWVSHICWLTFIENS